LTDLEEFAVAAHTIFDYPIAKNRKSNSLKPPPASAKNNLGEQPKLLIASHPPARYSFI
jgi:hypothetical protein